MQNEGLIIRPATDTDLDQWVRARDILWPSRSPDYHRQELLRLRMDENFVGFVAIDGHELIGFCEASVRPYVNGCESSPAPFVEGCWVAEPYRRRGIARKLIEEVERWAGARGFNELGSDIEIANEESYAAHIKWGFQETERVIYFRKRIQPSRNALDSAVPKVMLLGVFHFVNPRKDLVKHDVIDVMSKASQDYLEELSRRISSYKPTVVLLEYDPKSDQTMNARYKQYRAGEYRLSADETEQLGFRIAKSAGLDRVHSFDERDVAWRSQELFDRLKQEPELEARFNEAICKMIEGEHAAHSCLSLQMLLQRYNSPEMDQLNKSLYIMTNVAGVDEDFAGADAAASWWHRNFRMYARVQKFARPGERVLVIGGQGHIAVLRDLLRFDQSVESEEIISYL